MKLQFLETSPKAGTSHSLWELSGGLSQLVWCEGGGHAPKQGFIPQNHRALWLPAPRNDQRGVKVCVQAGLPRAVLQSRVPAPHCLCAGAELVFFPGSALSLRRELLMALWGETMAGNIDPRQGKVLLLLRGCCVGQCCSQLPITPDISKGTFKDGDP